MRKFAMAVCLPLLIGGVLRADPVQSGPAVGAKVPGPFRPLHVTGPDAGKRVCLYCKFGARPVAVVFAREITPAVVELLKRIDSATAACQEARLGSYVVFLGDVDNPMLVPALKQTAASAGIGSTIVTADGPTGPPAYHIASAAAVTVLLYDHHTVKANHAFSSSRDLNDLALAAILADLTKIVPRK